MKYIKFFEAFESNILSKTLSYIKDKDGFLNKIKGFLNKFDFPYSKISDEYFEYLPFRKAVNKLSIVSDEPCNSTSIDQFGSDSGISGEVCNNGKILRMWGNKQRSVKCNVCNGTGIKPKLSQKLKLVKYWFDKDGKYIATSGVDGISRPKIQADDISFNVNDFDIGPIISKVKLKHIKNDTPILLIFNDEKIDDVVAYTYQNYGDVFAIQQQINGEHTNVSDKFSEEYIIYTFNLGGDYKIGSAYGEYRIKALTHKSEKIFNVMNYNFPIMFGYRHYDTINYDGDLGPKIIDAHFALVLDIGKLEESTFIKVSDTKEKRKKEKENSLALLSDDEIKQMNLKRYLDTLSNIDIVSNIKNGNLLVKRALDNDYALFLITKRWSDIDDRIKDMTSYYYKFMKTNNEYYLDNINAVVKKIIKESSIIKRDSKLALKKIGAKAELSEDLNKIKELATIVRSKLNGKIDTIEDIEILHYKIYSIRKIIENDGYDLSRLLNYISINDVNDITGIPTNNIDRLIKLIKRL